MANRKTIPLKYVFDGTGNILALGEFMPGDLIPPEFLGMVYTIDGGAITDVYHNAFSVEGGKITDVYVPNATLSIEGGTIS